MTLRSVFSEENPFNHLKARQIFLCYFLVAFGLSIQFLSLIFFINAITGRDSRNFPEDVDPVLVLLLNQLILGLNLAWIMRQLKLFQIQPKAIIGQLPHHFNWLPVIGIVLIRNVFSFGAFRVVYYPLSFIFPSWVESSLSDNWLSSASQSFSPVLYYLLFVADLVVSSIAGVFVLEGIILHRWSTKWGFKSALIMLSIIYLVMYGRNFIGGISLCLMLSIFYVKTKTLIVPIVADIISQSVAITLLIATLLNDNPLEKFRSQLGVGIFCLAISTPILIWILYKI